MFVLIKFTVCSIECHWSRQRAKEKLIKIVKRVFDVTHFYDCLWIIFSCTHERIWCFKEIFTAFYSLTLNLKWCTLSRCIKIQSIKSFLISSPLLLKKSFDPTQNSFGGHRKFFPYTFLNFFFIAHCSTRRNNNIFSLFVLLTIRRILLSSLLPLSHYRLAIKWRL
jgi:hypothetical protein